MNERIRELAEQAEWRFADRATGEFSEYDRRLEKFALLIVRECAKRSLELGQPEIGLGLIKHFGVEESKGWVCPKCGTDRTKAVCPQGPSATVDGRCPMIVSAQ
jgi:hypothetical protein